MIPRKEFEEKWKQLRLGSVSARTSNPDWEGKEPCWDIELTNGDVHKRVTESKIREATYKVFDYPSCYMDIVRQKNLDAYNCLYVR
ncbi:MAG: hypothetical protein GX163_03275 [Bacteroidetes bacterium]|jgi:hypothetical protein|nr:hypothetical protein [Bacteroidota bacterium]